MKSYIEATQIITEERGVLHILQKTKQDEIWKSAEDKELEKNYKFRTKYIQCVYICCPWERNKKCEKIS